MALFVALKSRWGLTPEVGLCPGQDIMRPYLLSFDSASLLGKNISKDLIKLS